MAEPAPHRLLRTLDDLVRSDLKLAGLDGSVVVAVRSQASAAYWHAAFSDGNLLGCGYLKGLPRDADAILLFDEAQATEVVEGDAPEGDIAQHGDAQLLQAFVARYCTFTSMVDLRAGR